MLRTYITTLGDTWDGIALKELGSELRKDELMKNNITHRNIYIFPAGVELVIPEVEIRQSPTLPPWKRGNIF